MKRSRFEKSCGDFTINGQDRRLAARGAIQSMMDTNLIRTKRCA